MEEREKRPPKSLTEEPEVEAHGLSETSEEEIREKRPPKSLTEEPDVEAHRVLKP
jgi:hypothetical protein